jgi:hypothetical protein
MIRHTLLAVLSAAALGAFPGTGATAAAQAPAGQKTSDTIPREYRPPAGMCRIWVEGVPPAQQPAPTDCPTAVKNKPANGKVVYGETPKDRGKSLDRLPVKGFIKPPERKGPPLIPPDQVASFPRDREAWESRRITDEGLFGDKPAQGPASSYPGSGPSQPGTYPSPNGPMGSYGAYAGPGGPIVGAGQITDPRYFNNNPGVRPPGYGSSICLDRDGDGWCDDARFGPPVCLDRDNDGRCDDLPEFASQAYPQTLPPMRAVLDVVQGRQSVEVMQWLGTNEFQIRVPDQGRGGTPWRAIFLDQNNELLQVWTDTNRDGRADRVEIFRNGRRVKLIQR